MFCGRYVRVTAAEGALKDLDSGIARNLRRSWWRLTSGNPRTFGRCKELALCVLIIEIECGEYTGPVIISSPHGPTAGSTLIKRVCMGREQVSWLLRRRSRITCNGSSEGPDLGPQTPRDAQRVRGCHLALDARWGRSGVRASVAASASAASAVADAYVTSARPGVAVASAGASAYAAAAASACAGNLQWHPL